MFARSILPVLFKYGYNFAFLNANGIILTFLYWSNVSMALITKITPIAIPAFTDNYIWLLRTTSSPYCIVVDPGDSAPVLEYLQRESLQLAAIILTHHHFDHMGGVDKLLSHSQVPVYGPRYNQIEQVSHPLLENDEITIAELELQLKIISTPGHTLDHIAYYGENMLFCGDTLFSAGCGRLFEGSAEQMSTSLAKICQLPDNTQIFCAHEYTQANLAFALQVEPNNLAIQERSVEVSNLRQQDKITLPSTLQLEKTTNPFLRCQEESVKRAATIHAGRELTTPVEVFAVIRQWKDNFVY